MGKGSFGVVSRATWRGRTVAVKMIETEEEIKAFKVEVKFEQILCKKGLPNCKMWLFINWKDFEYLIFSHFTSIDSIFLYTVFSKHVPGSQIYIRDPKTYTIFIPALGSNWGIWVFLQSEYQVCMCCGLSMKINMRKKQHGAWTWRSWTHFVCICFVCVVDKKTPKPQRPWISMADDAITRVGIGVLESFFLYLWPGYILSHTSHRSRNFKGGIGSLFDPC